MTCFPMLAMCNEAFGETAFATVCRSMRGAGFSGIEIAPYTLGDHPDTVQLRSIMTGEGIRFVGLHWLMVKPPGLHLTTREEAVRKQSWEHLRRLIDLCGDLADGPSVMVLGSPKQRATTGDVSVEEAKQRLRDGLIRLAAPAESRDVTLLLEALPADQCDVVQTLAEAVDMIDEIDRASIQTMFDVHNAVDEAEPHPAMIERYIASIRHVHLNEMDGRHPGTGNYNFRSLLQMLHRLPYRGSVSLEVFDFRPDAQTIARETLDYLRPIYEEICRDGW